MYLHLKCKKKTVQNDGIYSHVHIPMDESFESYEWAAAAEGMEWLWSWAESQEASPEAIARVEKNQKKAKAIAQHIKKSKQQNRNVAAFLGMLLQNITSDKLIHSLHAVFFQEDTGGSTHNINDKLIAGLFVPFFENNLADYHIEPLYQPLIGTDSARTIDGYTNYLKCLSQTYHNDVALNQQKLTQLIIYLLGYFGIIDSDADEGYKEQIIVRILQDLFGIQHQVDTQALDF